MGFYFANRTMYTEDVLKEAFRFFYRKRLGKNTVIVGVAVIVLLLASVGNFRQQDYVLAIVFLMLILALLITLFFEVSLSVRRTLQSRQKLQMNNDQIFYFYAGYMDVATSISTVRIVYSAITNVIFTPNLFLLVLDQREIHILNKACFTYGDLRQFVPFLKTVVSPQVATKIKDLQL